MNYGKSESPLKTLILLASRKLCLQASLAETNTDQAHLSLQLGENNPIGLAAGIKGKRHSHSLSRWVWINFPESMQQQDL